MRISKETIARFERKIFKTDSCWLWIGSKDQNGYGRIGVLALRKSPMCAHRLSWLIYRGSLSNRIGHRNQYGSCTLCVLHKCDNPSCVNPDHLFLGTNADNVRDMINKGRMRSVGRTHLNSKVYKNNKAGLLGVSWDKKSEKWKAQIQFKKRKIHLGFFSSKREASRVRNKKAKEIQGI